MPVLTVLSFYFNSIKVRLKLEEQRKLKKDEIYFNSIKVRLKPLSRQPIDYDDEFQFHKGTIKTITKHGKTALYPYFNSIKVRLKLFMVIFAARWIIFQFHKGTIKTSRRVSSLHRSIVFQFHKGTIKTDYKSPVLPILEISIP